MAGVLGPNSGYPRSPPPPWALATEDSAVFSRFQAGMHRLQVTSQRSLDQSQAGLHIGENTPPPLWAYLCTLPQGVELFSLYSL